MAETETWERENLKRLENLIAQGVMNPEDASRWLQTIQSGETLNDQMNIGRILGAMGKGTNHSILGRFGF